jgi:glutathione-independent formaldehyde dehydrogenase
MKAVVYQGPKNVTVDDVPDATIEQLLDALIRISTMNTCGSDLHRYERWTVLLRPGQAS